MKKPLGLMALVVGTMVAIAAPAFSQERGGHERAHATSAPRANEGRIPPPPPARHDTYTERQHPSQPMRGGREETSHGNPRATNVKPHVDHNEWYGHDDRGDPRYHLAHPFPRGRFSNFGPSFRYSVRGVDRDHHRFWFSDGFYFEVAPWEWADCQSWCWTCPNEFVIYDDPDHEGWYLLYNVDTGVYVHVQYIGTH